VLPNKLRTLLEKCLALRHHPHPVLEQQAPADTLEVRAHLVAHLVKELHLVAHLVKEIHLDLLEHHRDQPERLMVHKVPAAMVLLVQEPLELTLKAHQVLLEHTALLDLVLRVVLPELHMAQPLALPELKEAHLVLKVDPLEAMAPKVLTGHNLQPARVPMDRVPLEHPFHRVARPVRQPVLHLELLALTVHLLALTVHLLALTVHLLDLLALAPLHLMALKDQAPLVLPLKLALLDPLVVVMAVQDLQVLALVPEIHLVPLEGLIQDHQAQVPLMEIYQVPLDPLVVVMAVQDLQALVLVQEKPQVPQWGLIQDHQALALLDPLVVVMAVQDLQALALVPEIHLVLL